MPTGAPQSMAAISASTRSTRADPGTVGTGVPGTQGPHLPRRAERRPYLSRLRRRPACRCSRRCPRPGPLSLSRLLDRPRLRGRQRRRLARAREDVFGERAHLHAAGRSGAHRRLVLCRRDRGVAGARRRHGGRPHRHRAGRPDRRSLGRPRRPPHQFRPHPQPLQGRGRPASAQGSPAPLAPVHRQRPLSSGGAGRAGRIHRFRRPGGGSAQVRRHRRGRPGTIGCILREHPARGDAVLALENPFLVANRMLAAMGSAPIAW